MTMEHLEIEPEPAQSIDHGMALIDQSNDLALVKSLPADFNIQALLTFLPDVRMKQDLESAASTALAIEVKGAQGVQAADAALPALRQKIADIEGGFEEPCSLANQLHKRLTGLRADFTRVGADAVKEIGRRIYAENNRLRQEAEAERVKAQAEADRQAREAAERALQQAKTQNAAPEIVDAIKRHAETAKAPPVAARSAVTLSNSTTVEKWKGRLKGTPDDAANPQPEMDELSVEQMKSVYAMMQAVIDGKCPITFFDLNWSKINARANADRRTFNVPGLEAYDAGSTRGKGRR